MKPALPAIKPLATNDDLERIKMENIELTKAVHELKKKLEEKEGMNKIPIPPQNLMREDAPPQNADEKLIEINNLLQERIKELNRELNLLKSQSNLKDEVRRYRRECRLLKAENEFFKKFFQEKGIKFDMEPILFDSRSSSPVSDISTKSTKEYPSPESKIAERIESMEKKSLHTKPPPKMRARRIHIDERPSPLSILGHMNPSFQRSPEKQLSIKKPRMFQEISDETTTNEQNDQKSLESTDVKCQNDNHQYEDGKCIRCGYEKETQDVEERKKEDDNSSEKQEMNETETTQENLKEEPKEEIRTEETNDTDTTQNDVKEEPKEEIEPTEETNDEKKELSAEEEGNQEEEKTEEENQEEEKTEEETNLQEEKEDNTGNEDINPREESSDSQNKEEKVKESDTTEKEEPKETQDEIPAQQEEKEEQPTQNESSTKDDTPSQETTQ